MKKAICPICKQEAQTQMLYSRMYDYICPTCGFFIVSAYAQDLYLNSLLQEKTRAQLSAFTRERTIQKTVFVSGENPNYVLDTQKDQSESTKYAEWNGYKVVTMDEALASFPQIYYAQMKC